MAELPGDVLEELTSLVTGYNDMLVQAKDVEKTKKNLSEAILNILRQHHCSGVEVAGCKVAPRPWSRETVNMVMARALIPEALLSQVLQTSSGISLDVRPLRGH